MPEGAGGGLEATVAQKYQNKDVDVCFQGHNEKHQGLLITVKE